MKKAITLSLGLGVLFTTYAFAQGQEVTGGNHFDVSMQFRPRAEYRDGNFRPLSKTEDPAALVSSRLRLNVAYKHSDILSTKVSVQNVALWGQTGQVQGINTPSNGIGVFEAWADIKIYEGLRTKIGRQTISLDDERLFGDLDWQQGGRSHDALSVYYNTNNWTFNTYFAFNQNYIANYGGNINNPAGNYYNNTNAQPYKYMQTLHIGYQMSESSHASFLFSNMGFQNADLSSPNPNTDLVNMQTTGLNYNLRTESINLDLSGYYQFGKKTPTSDISAFYLAADIMGKITPKFKLGLRSEYLSGNTLNQVGATDYAFNTLYGTGHKFNGHMDYFPYSDAGLWDNSIKAKFILCDKVDLNAAAHYFYTNNTFRRGTTDYTGDLGQEIDLNVNYNINSFMNLTGGYSTFFTNNNILALKGVTNQKSMQNWAWLSLNIHPDIFKGRF